jgi:hypothetical protein
MILLLGHPGESMITDVRDELQRRGVDFLHINNADIPGSVSFCYDLGIQAGQAAHRAHFQLSDCRIIDHEQISSVYHRLGFGSFECFEDYNDDETRFVSNECGLMLQNWLNWHGAQRSVINRPRSSGSNASKPYQAALFGALGLRVPHTLVTNRPEAASEFFEAMGGEVIYKSVSYVRSIVQRMKIEDLERLDTIRNCPLQLQEAIEGFDVRVHVVGDQLFATRILAETSDYRYDKQAEIESWELPEYLENICREVSASLELPLTGIDLRITPEGEAVCFEANPSPAFTWYEGRTGQPITAALCDLLING